MFRFLFYSVFIRLYWFRKFKNRLNHCSFVKTKVTTCMWSLFNCSGPKTWMWVYVLTQNPILYNYRRYSGSYFYNLQKIGIRQRTGNTNKNFFRNDEVVRRKNKNQYTIKTVGGGGWGRKVLHKSLSSFAERVR